MWSKHRLINDGKRGYLNSFGFTLLAIKYLQEMDILPVLRYDSEYETLEVVRESHPRRNEANVGQLVRGFFEFWGTRFDPQCHLVSILCVGLLSKEWSVFRGHPDQRFFLLQHPVQLEHNVAKNVRLSQWQHTQSECRRSLTILRGVDSMEMTQVMDSMNPMEAVAARFRALIQDTMVLSYSDHVLSSNGSALFSFDCISVCLFVGGHDAVHLLVSDLMTKKTKNNSFRFLPYLKRSKSLEMNHSVHSLEDTDSLETVISLDSNDLNPVHNLFGDTSRQWNGEKEETEERKSCHVSLEGIVGDVICGICRRQFATTDKRYVADRDEWVLDNACFSDGRCVGADGDLEDGFDGMKMEMAKDSKQTIVHRACFMMRQRQSAMDSDSDDEQLVPVLVDQNDHNEVSIAMEVDVDGEDANDDKDLKVENAKWNMETERKDEEEEDPMAMDVAKSVSPALSSLSSMSSVPSMSSLSSDESRSVSIEEEEREEKEL